MMCDREKIPAGNLDNLDFDHTHSTNVTSKLAVELIQADL